MIKPTPTSHDIIPTASPTKRPTIAPSESSSSEKTGPLNTYVIAAVAGGIVVLVGFAVCSLCRKKKPSKGFAAEMVRQSTIEIPASQVTISRPTSAATTIGAIV